MGGDGGSFSLQWVKRICCGLMGTNYNCLGGVFSMSNNNISFHEDNKINHYFLEL